MRQKNFFPHFYAIIVIALLILACAPLREYNRLCAQQESVDLAVIPLLSVSEMQKEFSEVQSLLNSQPTSDPKDYFLAISRVYNFSDLMRKFRYSIDDHSDSALQTTEFIRMSQMSLFFPNQILHLQQRYTDRFGSNVMVETAQKWNGQRLLSQRDSVSFSSFWNLFGIFYLQSLLLAFCFFAIRLKQKELVVWIELPRLIPVALVWPVAFFFYPTKIDPRVQLRQALEIACYGIAACVSIFGSGIATTAKAQTSPSSGKTGSSKMEDSQNGNKKKTFLFHGSIALFPNNHLGSTKLYLQSDYSWKKQTSAGAIVSSGVLETGNVSFFSNNFVGYQPPSNSKISFLIPGCEVGGSASGAFAQLGGKAQLHKMPPIGKYIQKVFPVLVVGQFSRVAGVRVPQETLVAWETRKLPLGNFRLASSGFFRIRPGDRLNFGEPEINLSHKKLSSLKTILQWRVTGNHWVPYAGLRFSF